MSVTKLVHFFLIFCVLVGAQVTLAQPPDQDFEAAPSGPVAAVGPSSTYTLDGVTYSATYANSDGQFVHDMDIGVFLTPQFLSLSAFNGEAQEVRISDESGDEFKFNSMDVSFGNCGTTGACNGLYIFIAYRDGLAVPKSGYFLSWAGAGPAATTVDVSSNPLWRNIDEIRVTKPGSSPVQREFYMAIDNLDFDPAEIQVGGLVTGLVTSESVVLQNNGGDDLTVSADGSFTFPAPLAPGANYAVTVLTQPGPISETCTVANGSGTIGNADISNVAVTCAINTFPVSGAVSGLAAGETVVLQNNGADDQSSANGSFAFSAQADGTAYSITVSVQPTGQTCSVANGSGTLAGAPVTNIAVVCVDEQYTIGGLLSGLVAGDSVVLQNNAGDNLTLTADGAFNFAATLGFGDPYAVTVFTQPGSPSEDCTVSNGTGITPASNVSNVAVICTLNSFSVGGAVSGLAAGETVILQNNGADDRISANGSFAFSAQADGSAYSITVSVQPTGQTCSVANGSGTLAGAPVTNIAVVCVDEQYTIGGLLSGLVAGDSVVLQNNAGDNLTLTADGAFNFAATLGFGDPYAVTVFTQPGSPSEDCTVSNGTGITPASNVSNVAVICTLNSFSVGGAVSGLAAGETVILQNNGADDRISANGSFAFSAQADGSAYSITVSVQPTGQTCSVANGSGTLAGAPVTNIAVVCVDEQYTIGGLLSGLVAGDSVVLQNNAGDNLTLTADGAFNFAATLGFGDPYAVTVFTQPGSPSEDCTVSNGTGITPASNVSNVAVICTLNSFSVGGAVSGLAAGETVILQNNGADDRISANGSFAFSAQADGSAYSITVSVQPTGQTCSVTGGSGVVSGSDISSAVVDCVDDSTIPPPVTAAPVPTMAVYGLVLTALGLLALAGRRLRTPVKI